MENLLKWSINASQNGKKAGAPDPKLISQLFGAPDDATLMREELRAAVEENEKDVRMACLEQFEEHVEHLDNANNIGKLWEPLLYLANSSDDDICAASLSCIAAAVQNNEKCQSDLVATKSGIPLLVEKLSHDNPKVLNKALLALSSSIAHCKPAYDQFSAAEGWEKFNNVFRKNFELDMNASERVKGRVLSLLYAIVLLDPQMHVYEHLKNYNILSRLKTLDAQESGVVKEKTAHILEVLEEDHFCHEK